MHICDNRPYGFIASAVQEFNPAPQGFHHNAWCSLLIIPFREFSWTSNVETYCTIVLDDDRMDLEGLSVTGAPSMEDAIALTRQNITRHFEEFLEAEKAELSAV